MKTKHYLIVTCSALLLSLTMAHAASWSAWQQSYTLEASGDYAGAAGEMEKVLQGMPSHELALLRRAWLHYLQGQYNAAVDDYRQVLQLNEKSLDARLGLTLPLMAQRRWQEAAIEARKVIALSNWNYTAHLRMLVCEEALQQWADLARHAAELSAHYPTDTAALVYVARAQAWQAQIDAAKVTYGKVLERMPQHVEALAYLSAHP